MMRIEDQLSEERLKSAVNASAAPVPESFIWNTEQMIDRLPRKERYIVRNKLSVGLVLTIILCMLTVTAVAAALLTGWELVEQEVLPMALENDSGSAAPLIFTNEELQYIVALAEENGILLKDSILRALEKGEGYWEEEVIMDLAKSQFGPYPGQWTLEEQYWFEETLITIGFQDYNQCRVPGEGELTYEEACAKAIGYFMDEGWLTDPSILEDRTKYSLWRSYLAERLEDGSSADPMWHFQFAPRDINLPTLSVTMDHRGEVDGIGRMPGLEEQLAAGTLRWYEVQDRFTDVYGSLPTWTPEVFVAYVDALGRSDLTNISKGTQAYLNTKYILPPEGALTSGQATEIALASLNPGGGGEIRIGGVYCFEVEGRALWKVTVALNSSRISDMVELDCMTGEIVHVYKTDDQGGAVQFYVPKAVREALPTPNPEGNG